MNVHTELQRHNDSDTNLLLQENLVRSLQTTIEALQGEISQSRQDVIDAEQLVNTLSQKLVNCEANMEQQKLEFEAQLKDKDNLIESKTRTLEKLAEDNISELTSAGTTLFNAKTVKPHAVLYKETIELRQSLLQKQSEADYYAQKYNDLLKEARQRPYWTDLEKDRYIQEQEDHLKELQLEVLEEQRRVNELDVEKANLNKRNNELYRQNTILIAQFSEQLLPCYYSDTTTEEDFEFKFDDIQKIIRLNAQLQQQIEALQSNQDSSGGNVQGLKHELDDTKSRLATFEKETEQSAKQLKRLQTSVDFYKMKYEENDHAKSESVPTELSSLTNVCKRPHSDSCRIQIQLNFISERLSELLKQKQQTEKNYEELLEKKDKLIMELYATKAVLDLNVQTQSSVREDMEKHWSSINEANRRLEEQLIKAVCENEAMKTNLEELRLRFDQTESEKQALSVENRTLISDLGKVRHEAIELQSKCEALAKNENILETAVNKLEEFRSACFQVNKDQLTQAKEQVEDLRKDGETLINSAEGMNDQQLLAMDKLETSLADVTI